MRIRHRITPDSGRRDLPVRGWIREAFDGPVLAATLDLYLNAPELHAEALGITLGHNQLGLPPGGATRRRPTVNGCHRHDRSRHSM
ncbi:MAG: hypothetical protein V2I38_01030 [Alcanivoracaceae bacterium]|jgi:hypothetical protein|nr:hypothetical protein [Alcanivoracaceae bacterium]